MGPIWSIILAAGESKRMGLPKMLLEFDGKTMLEKVIQNVEESDTDGILVVLGAYSERLTGLIRRSGVKYCYNENYKEGMLSSVKCGFRNLPADAGAVLVFQGDQPFISPSVINRLISEYRSTGRDLLVPVFRGKRGHPLLLGSRFREEVSGLDSKEGLRSIIYLHQEEVIEIEADDQGILRDFDTYDEYIREINQTR
jgi:molybdenum cofactor cytidylyltransferase